MTLDEYQMSNVTGLAEFVAKGEVHPHGNYHRGAVGSVLIRVSIYPSGDTFTVFLHRPQL
jgi:hypothetical protein